MSDPGEPLGAWTYELVSGLCEWSEETWAILGVRPGLCEPSREAWLERVHPDDRPLVEDALARVVAGARSFDVTARIVRPDGEERLVRSKALLIRDERGVERLVGTHADLTPLREARAELERMRDEFETLVERAPDVIMRFDRSFRHLYINRTRLLALRPEDVVGRTHRELGFPEDVCAAWEEGLARVFETRAPFEFEVGIESDGRLRWFAVGLAPERGNERLETVLAISREVTEQRQAEKLFRAFVESARDGVTLLRDDGTIAYASPAVEATLGYSRDELVGTNAFELVHPDDAERIRATFSEGLASTAPTSAVEFRFRKRDGSWCWLEGIGVNLLDDPLVRGVVVSTRDVTERRRLEEQVRQAQRLEAVGQLAGGIAHDFNNILLVIRGYSQLLADRLAGTPEGADIAEIQAAADRATELVKKLLAYGRRQRLEAAPVDLNEVVAGIAVFLDRLIGEDVELRTDLAPGGAVARLDAAAVEQAIVNLAANARDAMPAGGVLEISTRRVALDDAQAAQLGLAPGDYVALVAADNGVGMDEETKERLFEPFFTTKGEGEGTGLGLAMVHGFVAQSGGAVAVESAPGAGAVFTLYFPAAGPAARRETAGPDGAAAGRSGRVLLVEDEEQVRRLVASMLRRSGYEVVDAARPMDALELVRRDGRVDLLLTDVVMPQMSGLDLARRLRAEIPGLRVLLMSGYAESAARAGGWAEPVRLLQKPFGQAELDQAIRDALDAEAES